jgi:hypothetical protein
VARRSSRGARLAVREARLITKELRLLGIPPQTIAKIWTIVIAVPVIFVLGYLLINYDSGTDDPTILSSIQITTIGEYKSHVHNNTRITLKSLTLTCSRGGDSQPVTSTTRIGDLQPGYGEDEYIGGGTCRVVRVNASHQLW